MKKIALLANGPLTTQSIASKEYDMVIAVDGGLNHSLTLGLNPDLLVGDLDSVSQNTLKRFPKVKIAQFPKDKDKSDLELALTLALTYRPQKIDVFCGLGHFIDHALANLLLLGNFPPIISFLEDTQEVFLVENGAHTIITNKKTVSLLPLFGSVRIIETEGLRWNMQNKTLSYSFFSLSNICESSSFRLSLEGKIVVILSSR